MIDWLGITLALIVGFFFIFLHFKKYIPRLSCVLCAAVSATWIILSVVAIAFQYPVRPIIALLMSQSAIGILYAVKKRVPRDMLVFRLAYLCSAVILAAAVAGIDVLSLSWVFLAVVWIASVGVYACRTNPRMAGIAERIITCCKDW